MRASNLLLDSYYIDELSFSLDDNYVYDPEKEPTLSASDLSVDVDPWRHPAEPLKWYFRLAVRLDDKEGKFPYRFSVRLTGFFDVQADCPPDLAEPLALVNAPAILYASARELLALVTGRSRYLSVILPSVTFFEPDPKSKRVQAARPKKALSGKVPGKAKKVTPKK